MVIYVIRLCFSWIQEGSGRWTQSQTPFLWSDLEYHSFQKCALEIIRTMLDVRCFIFVRSFPLQRDKSIWGASSSLLPWNFRDERIARSYIRMSRDAEMVLSKQNNLPTAAERLHAIRSYPRHRFFSISSLFHFLDFFSCPSVFMRAITAIIIIIPSFASAPILSIFSCLSAFLSPSLFLLLCVSLPLGWTLCSHLFKLNCTHHMHPVVLKHFSFHSLFGYSLSLLRIRSRLVLLT